MNRTVVSMMSTFTNGGNEKEIVYFNLYSAPGNFQDAEKLYPFVCTEDDSPFIQMSQGLLDPDVVKCAGTRLFELLSNHTAVKDAMTLALAAPLDKVAPLYVYLKSGQAEGLPWETLYVPQAKFLALDSRWPIARIAGSLRAVPVMNNTFRPPLKVTLLLAAAGIDATPEWEAFYGALKNTPLELELQVFVCQSELRGAIESLHDQRIIVDYLPTKPDLFAAVKIFAPHILHFFCHGATDGGPYLQLATLVDWDGLSPRGSMIIEPNDLYPFSSTNVGGSGNTWLVTLNCCQGSAPIEDAYSLARSLVSNGFPVVVGMREVIASNDAYVFCKAFYSAILEILQEVEQRGQVGADFIEVDWAKALYSARTQLCDRHSDGLPVSTAAAKCKEWTLPVIYVRPETFMLRFRGTNPNLSPHDVEALRAQLKALRSTRTFMLTISGVPKQAFDDIDKRITELEANLYV